MGIGLTGASGWWVVGSGQWVEGSELWEVVGDWSVVTVSGGQWASGLQNQKQERGFSALVMGYRGSETQADSDLCVLCPCLSIDSSSHWSSDVKLPTETQSRAGISTFPLSPLRALICI